MKMMDLNSNEGIAGEFKFKNENDALAFTPYRTGWHWMNGNNEDALHVTVVLANGCQKKLVLLEYDRDANNHIPDRESKDPGTIGEQIANLEAVALIFHRIDINQNGEYEWEEYLPLIPLNWGNLRTAIIKAIKMTDDKKILFSVAQRIGISFSQ